MTHPMFTPWLAAFAFCGLNLLATDASADLQIAFDSAADAAYNDGWQSGDNGGFGLLPWQGPGANTSQSGHFVGDSSNNGSAPSGNINTNGRAWGMYANSDASTFAQRSFATPMVPGMTFSVAMDNGFIQGGGANVGFQLSESTVIGDGIAFFFLGGATNYRVSDDTGDSITGFPFTDDGFTIGITLTSNSTYDFSINGNHAFSGGINALTTGMNHFIAFNVNAGPDSARDAFFNSISITAVPEAGQLLVGSALAVGCVVATFIRGKTTAKLS